MIILPTIRQLQFFASLVRCRSFSKAAEECLVSQSTLSAAIKDLETALDCQLVDRTTRAFGLTPAGKEAALRTTQILAMTEDMARAAQDRGPLEGPFHLGVIPTIAPFLLPKAMPRFKKAFPALSLFLREGLTAALIERLNAGALDAVLLAFPYDIPGTDMIEIGSDPFVFAAAPGHPLLELDEIKLSDLKGEQLLLLEDGHCLRDHAMEACKLRPVDSAASFGATSLFTLAQMVGAGLGITLLPQMAVAAGFAKSMGLHTRPLRGTPAPARAIGLCWRRGSGIGDEAEEIANIFRGQFDPK